MPLIVVNLLKEIRNVGVGAFRWFFSRKAQAALRQWRQYSQHYNNGTDSSHNTNAFARKNNGSAGATIFIIN